MMSKKPPSATNDERDSSTSTLLVNADQTQRAQDEPNQKRSQLEDENLPISAPSGTSVFTARNANLATNIRFVDALQTHLNDEPNHHSLSHIGVSSMGVLPGQTRDDQDPQSFQAPPQPAAGDDPYFGRHKPDDQGYAQAFFQPIQPIAEAHFNDHGLEDQNCAQAFFQPIQPIAEAHFNDHQLEDQNCAQAFFQPIQSIAEAHFNDHGLEDQNCAQAFFQPIQPIDAAPFDNRGPNDQNCAQTFPQPLSPTGSNAASEYPAASASDFLSTADFLYHRLGHPCSLRSDELPPTTNLINHQNITGDIHQPSQHISGRSVDYHNIATSVDAGSQYIAVTPTPTAVVAA
ncbi:hypothetical protein N7494_000551 [Penicillium frequentans]|uniref:Uncharacterized protein n=1 Tax=Penicillium frequentans TaxID=3151616 RepID=A0AAD6GJY0_9EURO|nr:hypothetical protein N7494_000551 [Penicillium glabrum]